MATTTGRKRSPRAGLRRQAVKYLREQKGHVVTLIDRWDGPLARERFDETAAPHHWVPLEVHEMPENRAEAWDRLARDARVIARNLEAIARYADANAAEVRQENGAEQ